MILTLLLWIPLALITIVIRLCLALTKLTAKLALATAKEISVDVVENIKVDTGGKKVVDKVKDTISSTKRGIRNTTRVITGAKNVTVGTAKAGYKTVKFAAKTVKFTTKATIKASKLGIKALRLTITFIKLLVHFITWLAGIIASFGAVSLIVAVVMVVVVVVGGAFTFLWDDKINVKVDSSVSASVVNTSVKSPGSATVSGDLADLDTEKINYEVKFGKSNYKKGIRTNLTRADVAKLANLLMKKENTMSRGGSTVCKYLYYCQTNAFGRLEAGGLCGTAEFEKMNTSGAISATKNMKPMAGLMLSEKRIYAVDCSSFIGWFYATIFSAYDKDNKDLDNLANWFVGIRSTDYTNSKYCTKIDKKDVKAGDIKFTPAGGKHGSNHVVLCIDKDNCIGASSSTTGIKLGNLAYYDDAGAYYRPNFKFADE